ncbi:MAG: hypothetical protein LBG61_02065 [Burkholderiales bacterium]|nr:hypothetical protein [Burkholderiales bacterium]
MDKTINKRVKFSAGFTHYPIRFNRKNRKVYVHQLNGKIFVTKWEDIYFTLHKEARAEWVVRGLILDDDGETVLDAFDLPHTDNWVDGRERQTLTIFWEFVRRYMEGDDNDVRKLLPEIGRTMNVSNRKETFWEGYKTMLDNATAGGPLLLILINIPLMFGYSIGRKIAMMCNTIPDWPARIEAECAIEPNDPYLVDETHPPPAL